MACARSSESSAAILGETSRASIASSRVRQPGRSPRISAFRASSVSVAKAAAVAPRSANSSRARIRSRSAATVWPRSERNPPLLRSSCASQKASPRRRSMASARSVPASGSVVHPGVPENPDTEDLGPGLLVRVQRRVRQLELTQSRCDRTSAGEVHREPAASERGPPRQAVTFAGPDGAADRPDRPRVAELVLSEAERVERRDLGLRMPLPPGGPEGALCQQRGRRRVRLDQVERGLRELQRVVPTNSDCHADRCIRTPTTCSQYS